MEIYREAIQRLVNIKKFGNLVSKLFILLKKKGGVNSFNFSKAIQSSLVVFADNQTDIISTDGG